MEILTIPTGELNENCYFVIEDQELIIIDPGSNGDKLISIILEQQFQPCAILLTHGHFDHFGAVNSLIEHFNLPLYIHPNEQEFLINPTKNLSLPFINDEIKCTTPPKLLNQGVLQLSNFDIEVIETPGHSPGGVCFKINQSLFTGDTLFRESIGRTDFVGGNHEQLMDSLINQLLPIEENLTLYPGHGPHTTLYHEKQYNPYLKM